MNQDFYLLKDYKTRCITAENPTGEKGKGAMAFPLSGSAGEYLGKGWKSRPFVSIPSHMTETIADIIGPGEIRSIWIGGEVDQGLVVRMYWEDEEYPSVECPVPEFFLYGWMKPFDAEENHWNRGPRVHVNSALAAVNPNRGFNCFIPMPFRNRARITIENRTDVTKCVYYQINYEEKETQKDAGYFHAQFRVSMPVKYQDVHTILDGVKGNGVYIGTALYVGLNRASRWWGEGEVKFYLDGDEEYPSICTTGLEDYFCGAYNWDTESAYTPYSSLYTGMNVQKPDGLYEIQQRFSMYRWHVPDPIRFEKNIRVTVQDLGWIKDDKGRSPRYLQREDDFLSVAYWYQEYPAGKFPEIIDHRMLVERW